jgi:hypothetical protein
LVEIFLIEAVVFNQLQKTYRPNKRSGADSKIQIDTLDQIDLAGAIH